MERFTPESRSRNSPELANPSKPFGGFPVAFAFNASTSAFNNYVQTLAPPWVQQPLRKFGANPYGLPNFRVVWGPSRTYISGWYNEITGKAEYQLLPKYGSKPQWVLEYWRPSIVFGSPELWYGRHMRDGHCLTTGPFPAHGDYFGISKFGSKDPKQAGIMPEIGLIVYACREHLLTQLVTQGQRDQVRKETQQAQERQQDQNFDDMWAEKQLTRPGLSIGAGGAFNKQGEIDDYVRKLERNQAFVNARSFRPGFGQN